MVDSSIAITASVAGPSTETFSTTTSDLETADPISFDLSGASQRTDRFGDVCKAPMPYVTSGIPRVVDVYFNDGNVSNQIYFEDFDRTVNLFYLENIGDTTEFSATWFSNTKNIAGKTSTFYVNPGLSTLNVSNSADVITQTIYITLTDSSDLTTTTVWGSYPVYIELINDFVLNPAPVADFGDIGVYNIYDYSLNLIRNGDVALSCCSYFS